MPKKQLDQHRAALNKRRRELEDDLAEALRNREEVAVQSAPDEIDMAQLTAQRELAISNLDRVSNLLRDVKEALQRIADGTYGTCLSCEEPIAPKRLNAVPWTRYCVRCQEAEDEKRRRHTPYFSEELGDAA